jgi:hypothetical protein
MSKIIEYISKKTSTAHKQVEKIDDILDSNSESKIMDSITDDKFEEIQDILDSNGNNVLNQKEQIQVIYDMIRSFFHSNENFRLIDKQSSCLVKAVVSYTLWRDFSQFFNGEEIFSCNSTLFLNPSIDSDKLKEIKRNKNNISKSNQRKK